ncbi:hypothetical protein SCP_0506390 [Sparassis crispa]|uniref:Cytochrome b-c1 complex subunit 8 n=1 Tax=Sparassis crispa TaxID=139825 RepID=A0A401GP99_9APHY|nr:hypothetical protein SCP_0506390 [Sparassis crispa]GBE83584.1 hypothetical protein SCP_0506390 [Sparassis crispa]
MSPFQQRATHHMFRSWLFNGYRRLSGQMPYWIVPALIGVSHLFPLSPALTPPVSSVFASRPLAVRLRGMR